MIKPRNRAPLKCAAFFCLTFIFFFGVKSPILAHTDAKNSDTITVSATVPLLPGFVELIRKNSEVVLNQPILYPGESATLSIALHASGKEILRDHELHVVMSSKKGKVVREWKGKTDEEGEVVLALDSLDVARGRYDISVRDVTYPKESILLDRYVSLAIVERPRDNPDADDATDRSIKAQKSQEYEIYSEYDRASWPVEKTRLSEERMKRKEVFEMRSGP